MNSDESLGLLGALARQRKLAAVIIVLFVLLGALFGFMQLGTYSASAEISFADPVNSPVTGNGGGGSTVQEFARFVSGEARFVESDAVLRPVAKDRSLTLREIRGDVGVRLSPNEDFVIITGTSDEAEAAAELANDVMESYRDVRTKSNAAEAGRSVSAIEEKILRQENEIDALGTQIDRNENNAAAVTKLTVASDLLANLERRLADVQVKAATYADGVSHTDSAVIPNPSTVRPVIVNAIAGMLLGVLIAAVIVWLRVSRSGRRSDHNAPAGYLDVPLLGRVPKLREDQLRQMRNAAAMPGGSFQRVASALQLKIPKGVVLMSGVSVDAGCSMTSANVAVALARDGRKVVVIDADAGNETATALLAPEGREAPGLAERLSGSGESPNAIRVLLDADHELDVIPPGRAGPTFENSMRSSQATEIFDQMRDDYDYIIVDCPPMLDSSIVTSLARHANGVIVVVPRDSEPADLDEAQQMLALLPDATERVGYVYTHDLV